MWISSHLKAGFCKAITLFEMRVHPSYFCYNSPISTKKRGQCNWPKLFLQKYGILGSESQVVFDWKIRIQILKSAFRILQSNAENGFYLREIRPQGGFQLRNPNPDFMDFLFTVRLGNPKKDLQNCSREQRSSFC